MFFLHEINHNKFQINGYFTEISLKSTIKNQIYETVLKLVKRYISCDT